MSRDPELYPDPDMFLPERYINAEGQLDISKGDPAEYAFGFGRRSVRSCLSLSSLHC